MATEQLTVESYLTDVKALADELIETGTVAISMSAYNDRRLCKKMVHSIALQLDLSAKQYEVDFDGDEQEFIIALVDPDEEQSED